MAGYAQLEFLKQDVIVVIGALLEVPLDKPQVQRREDDDDDDDGDDGGLAAA